MLKSLPETHLPELSRSCGPANEAVWPQADKKSPVKHFMPRFEGSDPSLEQASRLFAAFVFVRNSDPLPTRFVPPSKSDSSLLLIHHFERCQLPELPNLRQQAAQVPQELVTFFCVSLHARPASIFYTAS